MQDHRDRLRHPELGERGRRPRDGPHGTARGTPGATTASASIPALMPALVRLNRSSRALGASGQQREPEDEQQVAQNAAGDRRLHQLDQAGAQRHDRDDQLGGVAERRVEQAADRGAGPMRQVLGRLAHVARQREHPEAGDEEHPDGGRVHHVAEHDAHRHREQQDQPPRDRFPRCPRREVRRRRPGRIGLSVGSPDAPRAGGASCLAREPRPPGRAWRRIRPRPRAPGRRPRRPPPASCPSSRAAPAAQPAAGARPRGRCPPRAPPSTPSR